MAREKVITVMCAARLPETLIKRIDSAAASGGVSRAQFIAEACRMRLDGDVADRAPVRGSQSTAAVLSPELAVAGSSPAVSTKPGMASSRDGLECVQCGELDGKHKTDCPALREICAGKIGSKTMAFSDIPIIVAGEGNIRPICGKTWWEDGEHYECMMDKGHREQKHGLRGMVRVLEP